MQFYNHPDCNTVLAPAPGDEETVANLPVTQGHVYDGENKVAVVRSYWVPSDAELLLLNTGRYCVALTSLSQTHPPIRLDVTDAKVDVSRLRASVNNVFNADAEQKH